MNVALESINRPSLDSSPLLPWWDKCRLLLHGRLTLSVERMTLLLHASRDPYNTTEEMEFRWTDLSFDWTNGETPFQIASFHLLALPPSLKCHWAFPMGVLIQLAHCLGLANHLFFSLVTFLRPPLH